MHKRLIIFLAIALLCFVGVGAYFYHVKTRTVLPGTARAAFATSGSSRIYFRYTGVDQNYGKLAVVSLTNLNAPQFINALSCEVVYFANGSGICLQADRGVFTTYAATLFDSNFAIRATFPLHGGPSRARVSPDGTLAGFTVFLSGHGYASLDFSTETLLIETATGKAIASLEPDFQVTRDGKPFQAKDFQLLGRHVHARLKTFLLHSLQRRRAPFDKGRHRGADRRRRARQRRMSLPFRPMAHVSPTKSASSSMAGLFGNCTSSISPRNAKRRSRKSAASTTRSSGSITIMFSTRSPIIPKARAGRQMSGKLMPPAPERPPCFCRKLILPPVVR